MFSAIFATFFALRAAPVQKHQKFCPNLAGLPDDLFRSIFAVLFPLPSYPFSCPFFISLLYALHAFPLSHPSFTWSIPVRVRGFFQSGFFLRCLQHAKRHGKMPYRFLHAFIPYLPVYVLVYALVSAVYPLFLPFLLFLIFLLILYLPSLLFCFLSVSEPSSYKFLYSSEFLIKEALNDCFRASAVYTLIHCAYKYSFI